MTRLIQNKYIEIIIHIMVWGMLFMFPLIFAHADNRPMSLTWYLGYCFIPLSCMIIFYINFFVLVEKLLFKRKVLEFILINAIIVTVCAFLLHSWHEYYRLNFTDPVWENIKKIKGFPKPSPFLHIGRDMVMMGLTAALCVAIKMTNNWYAIKREQQELESQKAQAELQNLKNQLNPHFLFNTLNNIYSLIAINQDKAQLAVHDLSKLLRHVLYEESQNYVPLEREIIFIKSYIELMSLRLSKTTDLSVSLPESGNGHEIAPLLFIPIIENSFKHGISNTQNSFIEIKIDMREGQKIECIVRNSNFPKTDDDRSGSGIGLVNLKRRLDLLYPDKYDLESYVEYNVHYTRLTIQL